MLPSLSICSSVSADSMRIGSSPRLEASSGSIRELTRVGEDVSRGQRGCDVPCVTTVEPFSELIS